MEADGTKVWKSEPSSLEAPALALVARAMISARRALHGSLPSELIPDPALDVLVRLFLADVRHQRLSAKSLADDIVDGATSFPRWSAALIQYDLVDEDAAGLGLTDKGRSAMIDTLRAVVDSQAEIN